MVIFPINVPVAYKRVTSTCFPELLLCPPFLENNRLIVILTPKRRILGWQILLPFGTRQELLLQAAVFHSTPTPVILTMCVTKTSEVPKYCSGSSLGALPFCVK